MLNPSRADGSVNDPTITRCINFAKSWGYGRLEVVNLFAYRTPKPSLLKQAVKPTTGVVPQSKIVEARNVLGRNNDRCIIESVERSDAYGYAPQIASSWLGAIMDSGESRIFIL